MTRTPPTADLQEREARPERFEPPTRDVEASLADALGPEATLSESTVSRICQAIAGEFDGWRHRDLFDVELEYLYLDGSRFRYHGGARAEPVLVAWGITTTGQPVFVALDGASSESHDACTGFLRDLVARGLRPPLLAITDGAPGLIGAVERIYAASLRQRCLVHRVRNVTAKVSEVDRDQVKAAFWAIFDLPDHIEPGEVAVAEARRRAEVLAATWQTTYPGAVACVLDDLGSLTTFLRFPREHWRRIRHTNLIERTFGASRRRVKVIGRLPNERSCPSLVWAVLDRASRGWRGVDMNPTNVRVLQQLRADLHHPHDTTLEQPNDAPRNHRSRRVTSPLRNPRSNSLFHQRWDATLGLAWRRRLGR